MHIETILHLQYNILCILLRPGSSVIMWSWDGVQLHGREVGADFGSESSCLAAPLQEGCRLLNLSGPKHLPQAAGHQGSRPPDTVTRRRIPPTPTPTKASPVADFYFYNLILLTLYCEIFQLHQRSQHGTKEKLQKNCNVLFSPENSTRKDRGEAIHINLYYLWQWHRSSCGCIIWKEWNKQSFWWKRIS